jgi:hypothetical protein
MTGSTNPRRRATADERRFLDVLCFWRALYAERGPQDTTAVASIGSVIATAEQQLRALRLQVA